MRKTSFGRKLAALAISGTTVVGFSVACSVPSRSTSVPTGTETEPYVGIKDASWDGGPLCPQDIGRFCPVGNAPYVAATDAGGPTLICGDFAEALCQCMTAQPLAASYGSSYYMSAQCCLDRQGGPTQTVGGNVDPQLGISSGDSPLSELMGPEIGPSGGGCSGTVDHPCAPAAGADAGPEPCWWHAINIVPVSAACNGGQAGYCILDGYSTQNGGNPAWRPGSCWAQASGPPQIPYGNNTACIGYSTANPPYHLVQVRIVAGCPSAYPPNNGFYSQEGGVALFDATGIPVTPDPYDAAPKNTVPGSGIAAPTICDPGYSVGVCQGDPINGNCPLRNGGYGRCTLNHQFDGHAGCYCQAPPSGGW